MNERIEERASFEFVRYANCWEDAHVLLHGLEPKPGGRILSIASGGDNSFALLTRSPELVVAVDLSPAQIALVDLKRRAILDLPYEEMLSFLGFTAATSLSRTECYRGLRDRLDDSSRRFWDAHSEAIGMGVIHTGKFERYFSIFRRRVLPLIHSRRKIMRLLEDRSIEERYRFYDDTWDTWRWRLIFRIFFSRAVMGRMGRDPEFFTYVDGSVGERIIGRVRHALTELPPSGNSYLHYILTGSFDSALPLYARREYHALVRGNMERLVLHLGSTDDAIARHGGGFDGMNLSDIFEYMDVATFDQAARRLLDASADGARLVYWNMLVERSIASRLPDRARRLDELSNRLHLEDRAFFYRAVHVDEVAS